MNTQDNEHAGPPETLEELKKQLVEAQAQVESIEIKIAAIEDDETMKEMLEDAVYQLMNNYKLTLHFGGYKAIREKLLAMFEPELAKVKPVKD